MPKKNLNPKRTIEVKNQYASLRFNPRLLKAFFHQLDDLNLYPIPKGELSVTFIDNPTIGELHDRFFKNPSVTDVITFLGEPLLEFAGEVCVSVDYAQEMTGVYKTSLNHELLLYLTHGWLHLAGLNDKNPKQSADMRCAEQKLLPILEPAFRNLFSIRS